MWLYFCYPALMFLLIWARLHIFVLSLFVACVGQWYAHYPTGTFYEFMEYHFWTGLIMLIVVGAPGGAVAKGIGGYFGGRWIGRM